MQRLQRNNTAESHLVLYYARTHSDTATFRVLDTLLLANVVHKPTCRAHLPRHEKVQSHSKLFYSMINRVPHEVNSVEFNGPFSFVMFTDETLKSSSLHCDKWSDFTPHLRTQSFQTERTAKYKRLILRRVYYSPTSTWNQNCSIQINRKQKHVWFIPFGTFNDQYSLFEADFQLNAEEVAFANERGFVEIQITPMSDWHDISYQLIAIS